MLKLYGIVHFSMPVNYVEIKVYSNYVSIVDYNDFYLIFSELVSWFVLITSQLKS